MKIGHSSDNSTPVGSTGASGSPKAGAGGGTSAQVTATTNSQSAGVAVTVSTLARTLAAGKRGSASDVDMEKVESVRTAIQQGTYVVNPEAIADKLLSNAQEMLERKR